MLEDADNVRTYKQKIRKQYTGLMRNFVGREKERPNLTADDFILLRQQEVSEAAGELDDE